MLTSVIGVVVLLGGLIFFHEFGHYSIAKLFGVKVEVFSLGFGKKLLKRKVGETEYCLSLFPLGGYVKLMGDDPYKGVPAAEADRAFSTQALYKRFLIVAAGPLANLLLAYVLFTAVFWAGKPTPSTQVGSVTINSPAWDAGIRPRDRIESIDGKNVTTWQEMEDILKPLEGREVELAVRRGGEVLNIPTSVNKVEARNPYGETVMVGGIDGIARNPRQPIVGISDPQSVAAKAGLETGDILTRIGTRDLLYYEDIAEALENQWEAGKPVTVKAERREKPESDPQDISVTLTFPAKPDAVGPLGLGTALGFYPSELVVHQITSDSPAEKGGLRPGDRIVKIGEVPIYSFDTIVDQVQKFGEAGEPASVQLEREGRTQILSLKPMSTTREDPLTRQPVSRYMLGFAPMTAYREADIVRLTVRDPFALVARAVSETNLLAERMVVSIWKLVTGQISVKNLGGPVLIASVAGKSLDAGIVPFLQMMALISINLFLLNLFPIPILDGGHLLFFTIEAVKGKPVSIRTMEIANQVGMFFILMLVGLTLFNDISRLVL